MIATRNYAKSGKVVFDPAAEHLHIVDYQLNPSGHYFVLCGLSYHHSSSTWDLPDVEQNKICKRCVYLSSQLTKGGVE